MVKSTSIVFSLILKVMVGACAFGAGLPHSDEAWLAQRVVSVVTINDLLSLENIETDEQKKLFQPRLKELLVNANLSKNNAKIDLLDVKKTSLVSKLWARLFLKEIDETVFTYFLKFPEGPRHLARLIIKKNDGEKVSFELLGKPVNDELISDSEFSLSDKTFFEYFFLFVVFLVPAFILYTFILCLRLKFEKRSFWLIFVLLGFIQYDMNWATGRLGLRPIAMVFFGSQFYHGPDFTPWVLSTSVPIGAVLFYWKRRKLNLPST